MLQSRSSQGTHEHGRMHGGHQRPEGTALEGRQLPWQEKLLKLKTALQIWIANDDNDVEGQWTNWYTGEVGLVPQSVPSSFHDKALEYAPWGYARPYDGGFRYNCMMLQV